MTKLRFQDLLLVGSLRVGDTRQEHCGGGLADAARRDGQGGEGRMPEGGLLDVVEAYHREIATGSQPGGQHAEHHAEGDHVVVAEDGGGGASLASRAATAA